MACIGSLHAIASFLPTAVAVSRLVDKVEVNRRRLRQYILEMDQNGSGRISLGDLQTCLRKVNVKMDAKELSELQKSFGVPDDPTKQLIRYHAYIRSITALHSELVDNPKQLPDPVKVAATIGEAVYGEYNQLRRGFKKFDKNHDFVVNRAELQSALKEIFDITLSKTELDALLVTYGDGKGNLRYHHFVKLLSAAQTTN